MHVLELEVGSTSDGTRVSLRRQGYGGTVHQSDQALPDLHRSVRHDLAHAVPRVDAVEASLLVAERRIGSTLAQLLGTEMLRAPSAPASTIVALVLNDAYAESLPWELLRSNPDAQADELAQHLTFVRTGPSGGAPAPLPRPMVEVALWCPDPSDPVCSGVMAHLNRTLAELHIPVVCKDATLRSDRLRIVHVVAHSARDSGLLGVVGTSTHRGVEAMVASLRPISAHQGVAAVVLDICGTGSAWSAVEDRLPQALLRAGCPAVRCPDRALAAEAANAANPAFYRAIAGRRTLPEATAEARRAVCALGLGRTDARWYRLQLHVGCFTPQSLGQPVVQPTAVQSCWPGASSPVQEVLARAAELALARNQAAVDCLDLARALVLHPATTPSIERLRRALAMLDERRLRRAYWHVPRPFSQVDRLSPRLDRWAQALRGQATPELLAARLVDDPRHVLSLRYLRGTLSDNTDDTVDLEGATPTRPDQPGRPVLEVLGGPEDGRIFTPAPGDVVGRRSEDTNVAHSLFSESYGHDAGVSRRHLRVVAWTDSSVPGSQPVGMVRIEGRVPAHRLAVGSRLPVELPQHTDIPVALGDVLILTNDTWLQVWSQP